MMICTIVRQIMLVFLFFFLSVFSVSAYPGSDPFDLLIITPEEFRFPLLALEEHKDNSGMPTEILTLEEAQGHFAGSDMAEEVKNAIEHFVDYHDVEYVMLVGDMDMFPVRWVTHAEPNQPTTRSYYFPSDLYYADLFNSDGTPNNWNFEGNAFYGEHLFSSSCSTDPYSVNVDRADFHPDVAVGRMPASTLEEVEIYVAKVIKYEFLTNDPTDDWFHNFTLLADDGRRCDPGIHFNEIKNLLAPSFSFESYISDIYFAVDADISQRPCICNPGESISDCTSRTGLTANERDIFLNRDGPIDTRPDSVLENIGFLAYHDHTSSIGNYNNTINNTDKFTVTFSDGCSDGGFAGAPPGSFGRFTPTGTARGQNLSYQEISGSILNVTFLDYYFDTDSDGDDERYFEIIDCVVDGISYPLSGDQCGGGLFPDMTFVDDFNAGGSLIPRDLPYILNPPPPMPLQPASSDREFNPERKLFAQNATTGNETGWIGLVAATKGSSFPVNGELESLFFRGYTDPHPSVSGRNKLGDMWRSMHEYWLDQYFAADGSFQFADILNKWQVAAHGFDSFCLKSVQHSMMYALFGDPSLRVGGIPGYSDTLPPVTTFPDGEIFGGSGAITIPLTTEDFGTPARP